MNAIQNTLAIFTTTAAAFSFCTHTNAQANYQHQRLLSSFKSLGNDWAGCNIIPAVNVGLGKLVNSKSWNVSPLPGQSDAEGVYGHAYLGGIVRFLKKRPELINFQARASVRDGYQYRRSASNIQAIQAFYHYLSRLKPSKSRLLNMIRSRMRSQLLTALQTAHVANTQPAEEQADLSLKLMRRTLISQTAKAEISREKTFGPYNFFRTSKTYMLGPVPIALTGSVGVAASTKMAVSLSAVNKSVKVTGQVSGWANGTAEAGIGIAGGKVVNVSAGFGGSVDFAKTTLTAVTDVDIKGKLKAYYNAYIQPFAARLYVYAKAKLRVKVNFGLFKVKFKIRLFDKSKDIAKFATKPILLVQGQY